MAMPRHHRWVASHLNILVYMTWAAMCGSGGRTRMTTKCPIGSCAARRFAATFPTLCGPRIVTGTIPTVAPATSAFGVCWLGIPPVKL